MSCDLPRYQGTTRSSDQPFVLPTSANIARPADALTQGLLVRDVRVVGVELDPRCVAHRE